ncbi:glutamyl-tRNA(Gln) amidotransferase subunit C, mitochondrial [Glossina fuscipes]|uniref:Glutamyl-tRNA(Gln) amidotransferase subunit C, mitochondrial n=1 Tax=Glossina fuscipes TaxID=7396 RepID=A0A9C5Z9W5_9MUSC|nr:glutamyl-tRNA(Gln) amidotransferase subunit C, mitochondrial [Glossina fuscipes]KAI9578554.1 hypothetical protein GQX74_009128 [Glossina fuscipes]
MNFLSKMSRNVLYGRPYCKIATEPLCKAVLKNKLEFSKLQRSSTVPNQAISATFAEPTEKIEIDGKTIQLLERLSLVNFDSAEILATLRKSIQFAVKISNINTHNLKPLYTVLEDQIQHLRDDRVNQANDREEILKNAKLVEEDYFISPPGNIPLHQEENNTEKPEH